MHAEIHTTTFTTRGKQVTVEHVSAQPCPSGQENDLINLHPTYPDQRWEGFGGAITDSAGYVYSLMSEDQRRELMHSYFQDLNYSLIRVPMDSCDFSLEQFEAAPGGDLAKFSMERAGKYILPMLADAQKAASQPLKLMLSPWSPPAVWKTNGKRNYGGKLKPEHRADWAEYLCRYIEEYQSLGYDVARMSIQNEPNATQRWDSCLYDAQEEKDFYTGFLKPALEKHGLGHVEVFFWDHNKERVLERALSAFAGPDAADGMAFHWYSGDHFEDLALTHRLFPEKKLVLSENCLEYYKMDVSNPAANAEKIAHEMIGDMNAGMSAFYDWNMLLDEKGGPNYVGNFCHAPYLFDTQRHELMQQSLSDCIHHFSHYILPGSRRIPASLYSGSLQATAFLRPDDSIAAVVMNPTDETRLALLRADGQMVETRLPAHSLTSVLMEK